MSNENNNAVGGKKKYPYLFTATELLSMKQNDIPYLWKPFLISQGLAALVGSSDVGKTSFLRQLAINIVLKRKDFLGHELNVRHGRVIYFLTEDNQISVNALLKKQIDKSINPIDLKGLCYIFNADNPFKVIEEQLKAEKTDLVIIDAYSDIFEGNSNDLGNVRKFLNRFEKLAQENDCAIIFLHHTGKRTELGSPSKNNIIGSQGFEAKMRIVWDLRKMEGNPNRFFQVTKGNYLPESQKSKSMELLFNSKQEFEFTGQFVDRNNSQSKLKFTEEEKTAIMKEVERMLADKLPYVTILTELKKLGFENTPSIGTLSNWIKEKKVVHSDENIEK
ncbi:MAG: AAA family ATPase [Chitinophagaceae bacterium]